MQQRNGNKDDASSFKSASSVVSLVDHLFLSPL